jgi:hypothetical protein
VRLSDRSKRIAVVYTAYRQLLIGVQVALGEGWPELMTEREASQAIRRGLSSLQQDRYKGKGIPYVRLQGQILYRRDDLIAYLDAARVDPQAAKTR